MGKTLTRAHTLDLVIKDIYADHHFLVRGKLRKLASQFHKLIRFIPFILFNSLIFFPTSTHASFIESTMGAAVVNDATATYYNPAALTLIKNPQIIALGSYAHFQSRFNGQVLQTTNNFSQSGIATQQTNYFLPTLYFAIPTSKMLTVGFAIVSNFFNRDVDENSILRYVKANNRIENIDLVPALGVKLNEYIAIGAGLNISHASFIMKPLFTPQNLTIIDGQSHNVSSGNSLGGDVGVLVKISNSTIMGLNYRSAIHYTLSGRSEIYGENPVTSNDFHFDYWTPARSVLSINTFIRPKLGLIATLHYIQWSILKDVHIHNVAVQTDSQTLILPAATVHYHLHNSWLVTLGSHYRPTNNWIIRIAGSFNQSQERGNYQISNGDSIILGASMGYEFNKNIVFDCGYAHAFIKDQPIDIAADRYIINGVNKGGRDSLSLKLTLNVR